MRSNIYISICLMLIVISSSISIVLKNRNYVVYYRTSDGKKDFKGVITETDTSINIEAPKEYFDYQDSLLKIKQNQ